MVARKDDSRQHIDDLAQEGALLFELALDTFAFDDLIVQAAVGPGEGRGTLLDALVLLVLDTVKLRLQALALGDFGFEGAAEYVLGGIAAVGGLEGPGFRVRRRCIGSGTVCRL
jgi:hypothetical protein